MNTMTNAMTWDAIAVNEGSKIEAMTSTETGEVSGAGLFEAIAAGAGAWAASAGHSRRNRVIIACSAAALAY